MIALVAFIILTLATARVTRVITIDDITTNWRQKIVTKHGPESWQWKLIRCYWCTGFWAAAATTPLTLTAAATIAAIDWKTAAAAWIPTWFAAAYATGRVLDTEEN